MRLHQPSICLMGLWCYIPDIRTEDDDEMAQLSGT